MPDLRQLVHAGLAERYTIERELGRGGMATVYLARDVKHERPVALKVLHPHRSAELGPERFAREIRIAARLQHPHILSVHDSGEINGLLWFTMPFVDGESLRQLLAREGQLPIDTAIEIAREVASALDFAHRRGVVHRDVKPENILLTEGHAVVADFGIARALAARTDEMLTLTGMAIGTPAYMSPEQASGERELDGRTDVYSLGCVLYEMLAGEPPFSGPSAQAILAMRMSGDAPPVRRLRPSVPARVEEVVARAMLANPAERFETAALFEKSLSKATGSGTGATESQFDVSRHGFSRRTAGLVTLVAAIVTLGAGGVFAWQRVAGRVGSGDGVGARAGLLGAPPSGGEVEAPIMLAVLPFENLGAADDDYFADGITDEVRGKLATLPGLRVTARQSSRGYRKSAMSLQQVARELGVQYLLTGTVRWDRSAADANRVRVSPELVHVTGGSSPATRWQQSFDAELSDVFQVQGDIAHRVAQALDMALGAGERRRLDEQPTVNLGAYDAFLRGEEVSNSLAASDPATLRRAIAQYQRAVSLDSAFSQAWAQLSGALSLLYVNGTPSPGDAELARTTAERAVLLSPDRPEGHRAMGTYYRLVRRDFAGALEHYAEGQRNAPWNADLLRSRANTEQTMGRWQSALEHLRRAQEIDPRSVATANRLAITLLWMRRYTEAAQSSDRALALAPATLSLIENRVMIELARGQLAGARAVLQAVPKGVQPAALAAYFATFGDLYWVLDDARQLLLLRLGPGAFDDDRGTWGLALAATYALRGDERKSRAYADSARLALEAQVRSVPQDAQRRVLLGTALAYLGKKAEAIEQGKRGTALEPVSRDAVRGAYLQHQLARIYTLLGEPDAALDQLEPLLRIPYYLSKAWLRIDPTFEPLRQHPRFARMVAETLASRD